MIARVPDIDAAPRPRMAHIVLRTPQPDALAAWYMRVLGVATTFRNERIHFVTFDDEHHRLVFIHAPDAQADTSRCTVDHWAYTLASLRDLLHRYEVLKSEGILPYWCINHGVSTSLYYADPDGNRVELQVDNLSDKSAVNAWFSTGEFDRNPVGITFDPDELVSAYREGVSEVELLKPHRRTANGLVGLHALTAAQDNYQQQLNANQRAAGIQRDML